MSAEEFKLHALDLLKYCLSETQTTAVLDELEDEELERSNAYCEGLADAISKIESLPTE